MFEKKEECELSKMNTPIRILGIVGSPRAGGNTDVLVDTILEGAKAAGAITDKVLIKDQYISPCKACDGCIKSRRCVISDDLAVLQEQMIQSDVWIFGTPVYYSGPTAQFKAFMDRWYSIDQKYFKDKPIILAIPLGDDRPEIARHTVGMFEDALEFQGSKIVATIIAPNVHDRNKILDFPELLENARRIGSEAVGSVKK